MLEILRRRRSARFFTETQVSAEQIEQLTEALLRAPTSRGFRPWEFIFIEDQDLLKKLAMAKGQGSAFLARAPLAVVIAADTNKSDVWIEDCAIAAVILQLMAENLGLGSCWAQIRNRHHDASLSADAYLKQLLALPDHFAVECIIGIGQSADEKEPHPADSLPRNQIHFGSFKPS